MFSSEVPVCVFLCRLHMSEWHVRGVNERCKALRGIHCAERLLCACCVQAESTSDPLGHPLGGGDPLGASQLGQKETQSNTVQRPHASSSSAQPDLWPWAAFEDDVKNAGQNCGAQQLPRGNEGHGEEEHVCTMHTQGHMCAHMFDTRTRAHTHKHTHIHTRVRAGMCTSITTWDMLTYNMCDCAAVACAHHSGSRTHGQQQQTTGTSPQGDHHIQSGADDGHDHHQQPVLSSR
eukprot:1157988-Pelagomonas_calceolata.AAC.4